MPIPVIVIVAVPYECCYKEGLWRKYQNTDSAAYGGQDYKIDSDFIVGYIDVENKNIEIRTKCPHNNELEIIQSKHIWLLPEDSVWQYENKRYFNLKKLIQECILK